MVASTPEKAVKLGNALVAAYLNAQKAMSDEIVNKQTAWLDSRVNDLRSRVEDAERRVQDYRDKNSIALADGHTSPERQLGDANAALVAARGKLAEVEARYTQLKNAMSHADAGQSTDDTIRSPVIEKLRQDYAALARDEAYEKTVLGPRHPTYLTTLAQLDAVQAQIKAETQRIFQATEREYKAAQATAQSAQRLVSNTELSTNKLGDEALELTDLDARRRRFGRPTRRRSRRGRTCEETSSNRRWGFSSTRPSQEPLAPARRSFPPSSWRSRPASTSGSRPPSSPTSGSAGASPNKTRRRCWRPASRPTNPRSRRLHEESAPSSAALSSRRPD